jgi:hypothetical protein
MTVRLNHTIVAARDKEAWARFLSEIRSGGVVPRMKVRRGGEPSREFTWKL